MEKNPTLTDYLSIIFKWKKFLIINLVIVIILAVGFTYMLPIKYKATATVMMTDEGNNTALGGMLNNVGSLLGGVLGGSSTSPVDKMFSYLESRQLMLKVIKKFELAKYYEISDFKRDKALKALSGDVSFDLTENGLIEISMIHKDPKTSAMIVNYFIEQADSLNRFYSATFAKKYREFVEQRYFKNLEDIKKSENDLENFQNKYKIYAIPEQLEIAFKAIAGLESELAIKELERDVIKETQGNNNPSFDLAKKNVDILKSKLNDLSKGKFSTEESIIYFSLKEVPILQKEYGQIYRELEVQSKLLEFTLPMYEQSLMEEKKNIPTIMVLDAGIPPELKNSPKRGFIVLGIFFLFLFLNIATIFIGEGAIIRNNKNIIDEKAYNFFNFVKKIYRM